VALERLRNEYPEVSEAYTLFSDLETRPYVEARLLTREPLTRTAQRFEVSDAAIEFYENVFFNFRDRTKALDWLWKVVIVGHVPKVKELSARRVAMRGLLMRYVAWAGGEHALDGLFANGLTSAPADRKQVHRSTDSSTAVYIRCLEAELESFIDGKVLDAKTLIKASEQLSRLQQEAQSREDPELCRRVIKVYDDMMRAMSGNSWRK
jgi:hypothetical protein